MGNWKRPALALVFGVWLGTWLRLMPYLDSPHSSILTVPDAPASIRGLGIATVTAASRPPPSWEREHSRRRVEEMNAELWHFLDALVTRMNESSGDVMSKWNSVADDLQEYHVAMSRELSGLRHVDGDEEWRVAESRQLGDLVRRRLDFLQNPRNCSQARLLSCSVDVSCGLGCQLHHATFCLLVAYASRRTLVMPTVPFPWLFYFQPLSSCTTIEGPIVDWGAQPELMESAHAIRLPDNAVDLSPHPAFLPPAIPADLAPRLTAFHGAPNVWWLGQFMRYVTRPTAALAQHINVTAQSLGFKTPVVGVHVRRGDKITELEAAFHSLDEYMGHVKNYFRHVNESEHRVFLATDDSNLMQEAQERYRHYSIVSNTNASGAVPSARNSIRGFLGIITDIVFLSHSHYLVCTFSSNVGRAAYALMQTKHGDAAHLFRSLDDSFYFHGQSKQYTRATANHTARDATELSFQEGDRLQVLGNHWNGLSMAIHVATGLRGLFPSIKAVTDVVVEEMPTYPEVDENWQMQGVIV